MTGTGSDLGKSYVAFVRGNMDQVAKKISDDLFVLSTMEVHLHIHVSLYKMEVHLHIHVSVYNGGIPTHTCVSIQWRYTYTYMS